jgi:hypothetical protein
MFESLKETLGFGDSSNASHPALKNFNRPVEMGKHVIKKTIKTAVVWGAVGAVAAAIVPGLIAAVPIVGGLVGTSGVLSSAIGGFKALAIIGAVVGGAKGVAGMDEAADAAEEQRILNFDRAAQRARGDAMFALGLQKQMGGMGANPGMLPMGKGMGGPQVG